jgi:hypothetical protein
VLARAHRIRQEGNVQLSVYASPVAHFGFCAQFGILIKGAWPCWNISCMHFWEKLLMLPFASTKQAGFVSGAPALKGFLDGPRKRLCTTPAARSCKAVILSARRHSPELSTRGNSQESPGGFPISTWKSRPPVGEGCGSIYPAYCSRILRLISGWWRTSLVISQR